MPRNLTILRASVFAAVFALLSPLPALAICCQCHPKDKPKEILCIRDAAVETSMFDLAACSSIVTKNITSNKFLDGVTCETLPLSDAQCYPVAGGGSAMCQIGPVSPLTYSLSTSGSTGPVSSTVPTVAAIPLDLNIKIPGLQFATGIVQGKCTDASGGSYDCLKIPYLAQYIAAIYNYLLGIVLIAAAVMVVYGGFKYILSSTASGVKDGKEVVKDALVGLVVALGMVTIMQAINPETVGGKALEVRVIMTEALLIQKYGSASTPDTKAPAPGKGQFLYLLDSCKDKTDSGPYSKVKESCAGTSGSKLDLVKVIKAYITNAVDSPSGAAYINGGTNGGRNVVNNGARAPFMYDQISGNADLKAKADAACKDSTIANVSSATDPCYVALLDAYAQKVIAPVVCGDLIGTDCGFFVSQALACAKANGYQNMYQSAYLVRDDLASIQAPLDQAFGDQISVSGKMDVWESDADIDVSKEAPDLMPALKKTSPLTCKGILYLSGKISKGCITPRKVCEKLGKCHVRKTYLGDSANTQAQFLSAVKSGKVKFGAIIMTRSTDRWHFAMYVGGSGDPAIPYDMIEMGGNPGPGRKGGSIKATDTIDNWLIGYKGFDSFYYVNTVE